MYRTTAVAGLLIVGGLIGGQVQADTVSYYQLDENSNAAMFDDVIGTNDMTVNGLAGQSADPGRPNPVPNPDSGLVGTGLFADGTQPANNPFAADTPRGTVTDSTNTFQMGATPFTLEGFFQYDGVNSSQTVFSTRQGTSDVPFRGYYLRTFTGQRLEVFMQTRSGSAGGETTSVGFSQADAGNNPDAALETDSWHHFAVVWDPDSDFDNDSSNGNQGTVTLYQDANTDHEFITSGPGLGDLSFDAGQSTPVTLGFDLSGSGDSRNGWGGLLDEFRFSDEILTPNQFLNVPEPATLGAFVVGGFLTMASRRRGR